MSKPKSFDSWPPEKQAEWILAAKTWSKRYRTKHAEKVKRQKAKWRAENNEKVLAQKARIRKNHPETDKKIRARARARVTDCYLAQCKNLSLEELRQYPRQIIDAWKAMLQLSRKLKQLKKQIHENKNDNH